MAPFCSIDLTQAEQTRLLEIARRTINAGLNGENHTGRNHEGLTPALQAERGVFVTLTRNSRLRGCIGTIDPTGPLAVAVATSAYNAAFRDPRFPRLALGEAERINIEISVLTPAEPLAVASRAALLASLQPGQDGLVLEDGRHRSTLLPKVWEQLPEPDEFIDQLLAKAGLPAGHWSPSLRVHRYRTLTFGETTAA